jgi:hypothetical protein
LEEWGTQAHDLFHRPCGYFVGVAGSTVTARAREPLVSLHSPWGRVVVAAGGKWKAKDERRGVLGVSAGEKRGRVLERERFAGRSGVDFGDLEIAFGMT